MHLIISKAPQSDTSPLSQIGGAIDPTNLLILAGLASVGLLSMVFGSKGGADKKNRQATSQWATRQHIWRTRMIARQQINDRCRNAVSLYIVQPKIKFGQDAIAQPQKSTPTDEGDQVVKIEKEHKTLYLTDTQRGIAVIGAAGTGKTHSVLDPLLRSSVDQGFPIILYDYKYPVQSSRIAAIATQKGYEVSVFAPGFPESCCCNPLDFIQNAEDVEMARQIATVLNRNLKTNDTRGDHPFFANSGEQLILSMLLLAKTSPYPDLAWCQVGLSQPELAARIHNNQIPLWVKASFSQFLSMGNSPETVAGVISTASLLFSRLVSPSISNSIIGKTNLPLDLKGKQMIILGMDQVKQDVVAPLIASTLEMLIARNANGDRTDPLILALDEATSMYFPNLIKWLSEFREYGLNTILGFQNLAQVEDRYGKEKSRIIFANCATKFFFNPQDDESAQQFSKMLGEEQLNYSQKSRTHGKHSSISISPQDRTRKLCAPEEFGRLTTGHCILQSPGIKSKTEAFIPVKLKITIPEIELARMKQSQHRWRRLKENLIQANTNKSLSEEDLYLRTQHFTETYPTEEKTVSPSIVLAQNVEKVILVAIAEETL